MSAALTALKLDAEGERLAIIAKDAAAEAAVAGESDADIHRLAVEAATPPYNIVKKDSDNFVIEIAAAGFTEDEFNIHVVPEGNKLVVQGVQDRGEDQQEYYHKGIAARNFTRTFALAEGVQVEGADFVNGMLLVSLHRVIPEEKKLIEIKVNTTPQLLQ